MTPKAQATSEATEAIRALRKKNSWLGKSAGSEKAINGGRYQNYENGRIYWSRSTGAKYVRGLILQELDAIGGTDRIGFPRTNEYEGPRGSRQSEFTGGRIYWSPSTGAHAVLGDIYKVFTNEGSASGPVGLPTSGEFAVGRGAVAQRFQHGLALWTPQGGAHMVRGMILNEYAKYNWERGPLGLPVSNEGQAKGARVSYFEHGAIYWSRGNGTRTIRGDIYKRYMQMGRHTSALGVPMSSEFSGGHGTRVTRFQHGGLIIWKADRGAKAIYGKIVKKYGELDWERGPLGAPLSNEFTGGHGVRVNTFDRGAIYWHPTTGADANAVYGKIFSEYHDRGRENGVLGMPTSSEFSGGKGSRVNRFQNGIIIWTARTGSWTVRGKLLEGYAQRGYERGSLGAPKGNEFGTGKGWAQDFEGGRLYYEGGKFRVEGNVNVDPRCQTGRVLCISKGDRKMRWMIDGRVIKTFDARFGKASTPTRNGTHQVFRKVRDEVSWMYGNTPMPFAMYFDGGQAVHYSYDFAARGYAGASHGCVNIRDYEGLQWLYDTQVKVGDKVVVY
ncbi:hypothetical protein GCM10009702_24880 [Propioniferax innocua]